MFRQRLSQEINKWKSREAPSPVGDFNFTLLTAIPVNNSRPLICHVYGRLKEDVRQLSYRLLTDSSFIISVSEEIEIRTSG